MNKILDGKKTSLRIKEEIKIKVDKLISEGHRPPHLAAILVGEDGARKDIVEILAENIKSKKQN